MSTSTPSDQADRALRRAWVAVALVPVAVALGTVAGEGLISLLGYDPHRRVVPLGVIAAGTTSRTARACARLRRVAA